jgi:hypothetical protein
MTLKYLAHTRTSLKEAGLSEAWLHERIKADPAILGLGELSLLGHEKVLQAGGRLDILLGDDEDEVRYEVEIMLGATDPSHIIRCIEYWDIERRRYPAYEHIAVLVSEDVTARFLNVMSLLAGSIPLIAIQLNALRIGEQVVLDFVKVLDQRMLRLDPASESAEADADRGTWDARVGQQSMKVCDQILNIANEVAKPPLELKYKKQHVGIAEHGSFFNVVALWPRKSNAEQLVKKAEESGIEAQLKKGNEIWLDLQSDDLVDHDAILREAIQQAIREAQT